MPALGLVENVKSPLGKCTVVDQIKNGIGSPGMATLGNVVSALGGLVVMLGVITGWITVGSTNAHDMALVRQQLTDAQQQSSLQFDKLIAKLDTKLGPEAMNDTVRRLSEITGQLAALDMRERQDQDAARAAIIRMQTQMEQILVGQKRP